ncbi:Nucleoprotein TPR isoform 1 [Dorcoceras hygrometricum]|uniref:Nucleoprotein TPR isoform 1 n=1 Tax=Dorcoceras hygrometricum TaxID=472368 RepID=A0A2Z7BQB7_9LAMI|nr:Nucleoprotein TPR isoform 1 [Dorcoceras hygrometricum]
MGNTDPTTQKQENKYKVEPQYEELSKQLIMQHAKIDAMQCMRAIKDRIARPVYQLENHLNQPLYPQGVSTGEIIVLEANTKLRIAGNPYPEAETSGRTIEFHCTKNQQLRDPTLINSVLEANTKLRIAGNPYPEAETSGRTIEFHCTKNQQLRDPTQGRSTASNG